MRSHFNCISLFLSFPILNVCSHFHCLFVVKAFSILDVWFTVCSHFNCQSCFSRFPFCMLLGSLFVLF